MRPSLPVALVVLPLALLLLPVGTGAPAIRGSTATATVSPDLVVASGAVHPAAQSCATNALCVAQVQTAYNFSGIVGTAATDGHGQTIVIVDACGDPSLAKDVKVFDTANALPAANLTITSYGGGTNCRNPTWSIETSLDVEWAHAMAPGAKIDLLVGTSSRNAVMFGAWDYALAHHLGAQISNSWGGKTTCSKSVAQEVANATAQNVTILSSAGDNGAWGTGTRAKPHDPADCTDVVSVGGTTLSVNATGVYLGESAWAGSGGGYAPLTHEPSFEKVAKIPDAYGELGTPDVAAVADPNTGVWIYNAGYGGWTVVGGTSVACPIWAALLADANAERAAHGFATLGSVDRYLFETVYGPNGTSAHYATDFHDVTTGSNGWAAGTGWDPATGLGSMNAGALVAQLGTHRAA